LATWQTFPRGKSSFTELGSGKLLNREWQTQTLGWFDFCEARVPSLQIG